MEFGHGIRLFTSTLNANNCFRLRSLGMKQFCSSRRDLLSATRLTLDNVSKLVKENAKQIKQLSTCMKDLSGGMKDLSKCLKILNRELNNQLLMNSTGNGENRDAALESITVDGFIKYLEDNNWNVNKFNFQKIYSPDGTIVTEWDGIALAKKSDYVTPMLFFIDTKEVYNTKEYVVFKERLQNLERIVLPKLNPNLVYAHVDYLNVARVFADIREEVPFKVVGIVASQKFEPKLLKTMKNEGRSYILSARRLNVHLSV